MPVEGRRECDRRQRRLTLAPRPSTTSSIIGGGIGSDDVDCGDGSDGCVIGNDGGGGSGVNGGDGSDGGVIGNDDVGGGNDGGSDGIDGGYGGNNSGGDGIDDGGIQRALTGMLLRKGTKVLFRGTHWTRFWSLLQKVDDRPAENITYRGTLVLYSEGPLFMLSELEENGAAKVLLLLWRTWHVGKEITHNSVNCRNFLVALVYVLNMEAA